MKKLLYIIPVLILLTACTPQREVIEVPVETIKTEYIHDVRIDSIYERDSVDRWRDGDTVFIYKEHTKYKYLNRIDTIVKVDSIPKLVKIKTKEVVEVNHIKWYQKALMWIGGITMLLLTGGIIYKLKFK